MEYIQSFLSLCLNLTILGIVFWFINITVYVVSFVFPYALAVVLAALCYAALNAWRRSHGY